MKNITEIKFKWCTLCGWYIECPICGNNSCNGGRGTVNGKECEYCDNIYFLQDCIDAEASIILTKLLTPKIKKVQKRGKDGRFL